MIENNLEKPNYSLYRAVFENEQQTLSEFTPDETDAIVSDFDYIQSGIVADCIKMLTDFAKFTDVIYDFGDATLNAQFETIRSTTDFDLKIETLVNETQLYGNGFIQVARENDTTEVYTPNPEICYAEYDVLNPQKAPYSVNISIQKEYNKKTYTLVFKFKNGEIIINAFDEKNEKVDPYLAFEEVVSKYEVNVRTVDDIQEYYIITNATFSLLQLVRLNKPSYTFYGKSLLTNSVLSKLAKLNLMYMLAKKTLSLSANPKFQMSKSTARMIEEAIGEVTNGGGIEFDSFDSLTSKPEVRRHISVSRLMSEVFGYINKKLVFFKGGSPDEGKNEYIVNNYSLQDLYTMIDKLESEIRNDLNISTALTNPELSTGAKSGIAYKRLMQKTLNHVDNLRRVMRPVLQRVALTVLELESNTIINKLPTIIYPEIIELEDDQEEVKDTVGLEPNLQSRQEIL